MLPISKISIIYILIIQVARGIVAQVGDINDFFKGESHDLNSSPTLSGFIAADDIVFRVIKRINRRSSCLRMEFINIPFNTTSPLVGGRTFTLLKDKLVAGRFAWSNGPDFISFVATVTADAPYGTWMLSNKIGDESGYGFNKPRQPSLVPFDSTMRWSWLENKRWERNDDIQLICKDDVPSEGHFYQVEYFTGTQAHTGYYSPNMFSTEEIDSLIALNVTEDFTLLRSLARPTIWNNARLDIMNPELTSPPVLLVKFGSGTYITDRKGRKTVGHLVQQEHGADSGWNLAFRRVVGTEAEEKMSGWNFEDEIILYLDGNPATPRDYVLTPMTAAEEAAHMTYAHKSLETIQKGQYVSIYYHRSHVDKLLVQLESNVDGTSRAVEGKKDDMKLNIVEEEVEILLECVARTQSKVLFKYHHSDRREVLYQDLLSKESTYFTYTLGSGNDAAVMTDASGIEIDLTYYEFIGSDVIGYIREYLKKKDNTLQHLSSCYFYHAAVTLPKALIYAAEIVCVLTGAKPLTLVSEDIISLLKLPISLNLVQRDTKECLLLITPTCYFNSHYLLYFLSSYLLSHFLH